MDDMVSRQAAIDALKEHRNLFCDNTPDTFSVLPYGDKCRVDELDMAIATLINLPSAQPETHEERTETHACDLIDRQQVLNLFPTHDWKHLYDAVKDLPSAQPEMNLDEWCTDCKEYDKNKHCCPRWNRVIRTTLKDMKEEQPEIIHCKDCVKHNKGHGYYLDGTVIGIKDCCPLVEIRGMAQGHEFDYQYCAYAERRTDEGD